jgi:hypothetical protein
MGTFLGETMAFLESRRLRIDHLVTCLLGPGFADEDVEVIASWAPDATQQGQADRSKIGGAVLWS